MNYNEITRRYFERAPHAGMLEGAGVFRGAAGRVAAGFWVQFDVRVDQGRVEAVKFLCFGCPHSVALAAYVAERAAGKPLEASLPEGVSALKALFELPAEKLGRLLLIEDAWRSATGAALEKGPGRAHL